MIQLYRAPYTLLLVLAATALVCTAGQAGIVFLNWHTGRRGISRIMYDVVSAVQLVFLILMSYSIMRIIASTSSGIYIQTDFPYTRYVLFFAMLVILSLCKVEDEIEIMWYKMVLASFSLPVLERVWGRLLAQVLFIMFAMWIVCEVREYISIQSSIDTGTTAFSVRVAMKRVGIGIMLARKNGDIFFINKRMQHIMNDMFGSVPASLEAFQDSMESVYGSRLENGDEKKLKGQVADWNLSAEEVILKGRDVYQISAREIITEAPEEHN
ncbi:MAG: hypothetical protein ACI4LM_05760 [Anaerovoracaceae bacterium]